MNLDIDNQHFLVCGASSGFGQAISERLLEEGAHVTGIARSRDKLEDFKSSRDQFEYITGDLTREGTLEWIAEYASESPVDGVVLNAGGPPPGGALEPEMEDWDEAYQLVMRWKIDLTRRLIPKMQSREYGRILFVESQSIKQPIPDLVLSNAFRAGIAGFVKTLAKEVAGEGVNINILAPGAHDTPAIERVIAKKAEKEGISRGEARRRLKENIPVGRMGHGEELSSLAAWLLSPLSFYVTGQVLSHEGGNIDGLFG